MAHGFLYEVAIMDWHSRKVLAWRLSNTQPSAFCIEALEEALEKYGPPDIFNTDQGSQFTVLIERQRRSMKYACFYLNAFRDRRMSTSLRHLGSEFKLPLASPQVG